MANQILIKNTMQDMRDLPAEEIAGLQGTTPIYSGVKLLGYYKKGDTPEPIIYYLAPTDFGPDDGGSVIAIGGIKLIHNFVGNVNVLYFGAKGVEAGGQSPHRDDYPYIQNALNYCDGKGNVSVFLAESFILQKHLVYHMIA